MKRTKLLLAALMLLVFNITNAQVNTPGTIYAGAGIGIFLGGGSFDTEVTGYSESSGTACAAFNLGLKAQYAFAKKFSAGVYLKTNAAGYAIIAENSEWNAIGAKQLMAGIDVRYYILNKNKIALTVGPQIGFISSKDVIELSTNYGSENFDGKSSGINYGINVGFNFFWTRSFGIFVDLGLNGSSLNGDFDDLISSEYTLSNFGLAAGVGIVAKFGGTPPPPRTE